MPPEIAVGLLVLAFCPGGPSSHLITYLARGDIALSVMLKAISSLITVFTITLFTNLALQSFLRESATIALPLGTTTLQIILVTLVPTAIGMAIRMQAPATARRLERQMSRLAAAFLALIIVVLLIQEGSKLSGFLAQAGLGALLLNVTAGLSGLLAGRLCRLPPTQQIAIAIEVGLQNGTLAIAITAGLLNNADMAVPAAVDSLLMSVTGLAAIDYGRRTIKTDQVETPRHPCHTTDGHPIRWGDGVLETRGKRPFCPPSPGSTHQRATSSPLTSPGAARASAPDRDAITGRPSGQR